MYNNQNGENVNENPNGAPNNGPDTYNAPNEAPQQTFNQADYNVNNYNQNTYDQPNYNQADYNQQSFNQTDYNQPNYNQPNYNQADYNQQTYQSGNSYNAAPSYNLNGNNGDAPKKSCVFGILGLILGIAAFPFGWFIPIIGIILGIAALVLSIIGMGKNRDLRGAAIGGLIISILATVFSIGVVVYAVVTVTKTISNAGKDILDNSGISSDFSFDDSDDDDDDYDYDNEEDEDVPLDNVVLFSNDDITITATSITYSSYDDTIIPEINVVVENNSTSDIGISIDYCAINDVSLYGYISGDIAAGKKSNEEFSFDSTDFNLAGFKTIDNLKFMISYYDSDSYDTLYENPDIQSIDFADSYTPFSPSSLTEGAALDSNNGINVYYAGTSTGWYDTDLEVVFYIENTTSDVCTVESDDFSINDFMQNDYGYISILPGTGAFMSINCNDDIDSLDDITNASIKFEAYNRDTYETFYSSDELTFISK